MRRVGLATLVALVAAMIAVATASATRATDTITCGSDTFTLTVTQTSNENSVAWGVGTISGGSHLTPTSFSFAATDVTANNTVLFSDTQAKGKGNGQHNQEQMTCNGTPESATAGELGIPGVNPDDVIEITFTVTAVPKL
jgi:secreted trypsin-like serine protease